MQPVHRFTLALFCCALTATCFAQKPFSNCAAVFLDNKMVVDEYSPKGQCSLAASATGDLTVCTADLSPTNSVPVDKIKFKVAIRDHNTGTLTLYSNDTFKQISIQKVLAQCQKDDRIVLITIDNEYALPHNEILVK